MPTEELAEGMMPGAPPLGGPEGGSPSGAFGDDPEAQMPIPDTGEGYAIVLLVQPDGRMAVHNAPASMFAGDGEELPPGVTMVAEDIEDPEEALKVVYSEYKSNPVGDLEEELDEGEEIIEDEGALADEGAAPPPLGAFGDEDPEGGF